MELKAEGYTDYLMIPLLFSDGSLNTLAIATKSRNEFAEDERRRTQGERSVSKEAGPSRLSEGVRCLYTGVFFAVLLVALGTFLHGRPEPLPSLGRALTIFGGLFMLLGYVGWRRLGGSPKRTFTLLTRETLVIRGLRNVILHVPSIVEVRTSHQGNIPRLRLGTRDGKHVLVDDLELEGPLKEFAGLVPPGWEDPTITFSEALKRLGKPWFSHFWMLVNGEVTTISKYGVTRYLRKDVEALKAPLKRTS